MKVKGQGTDRRRSAGRPRFALRPIALGVAFACCSTAGANPVGPKVTAGSATFNTAGTTLNVTNAPGTIINWKSFSIGSGEHTRFLQQSASSAVLNRVTGSDASSILGALSSNGRVFLVNPHGIVFGAGARIDTAGFIASTLNIADRDFLQGRFKFEGGGNGILRNEGHIRASGDIMLVGPAIENAGLIRSEHGSVILAAGKSVTITSPDAQGVKFALQAPTDSAVNLGAIEAANAAAMFAGTLVHSGDIRATTATMDGGRVVLSAQKDAIVQSGGMISASGAQGGSVVVQSGDLTWVEGRIDAQGTAGKGGHVQVLSNRVGLSGARVDVSGESGGGTILVGGDYQGKNREIQNAWRTFVGPDAKLRADAVTSGDGGKVIVWADDITRYYGDISARGGRLAGNGGFVEVSGKGVLDFRGTVDTRAPNGHVGTLLLDPTTINFVAADDPGTPNTPQDGPVFRDIANNVSEITYGALIAALGASDVTVNTSPGGAGEGDINFTQPFDFNGFGAPRTLTLIANRDINISNPISDSVPGGETLNLVLNAAGVTNITASVSLGGGVLDANSVGSRVVNMNSGSPTISNVSAFNVGTLSINGANTSLNSLTNVVTQLRLSSGTLGGTGALVAPVLNWFGGTVSGSGLKTFTNVTSVDSLGPAILGGSVALNGGMWTNNGTLTHSGVGQLTLLNGAVVNNVALFGNWNVSTTIETPIGHGSGAATRFNNIGTFRNSDATHTLAVSEFRNAGIVMIDLGSSLVLPAGAAGITAFDTGMISVGFGGTIGFNGDRTLDPMSMISGGNVTIAGGTLDATGSIAGTQTLTVSGGIANFTTAVPLTPSATVVSGGIANFNAALNTSALTVSGGIANINVPATIPGLFTLSAGTLGGTGLVTLNGAATWSGGTMTGSGTTLIGAGMVILGNPHALLGGRTLENSLASTVAWSGGDISVGGGATISNPGTWSDQSTNASITNAGGAATFSNAGTYTKLAAGTSTLGIAFNNAGAAAGVDVQTGTLRLSGGGASSRPFAVTGALDFAGNYAVNAGSNITGGGTVGFSAGTTTLAGGTYAVAGGTNVSGGTAVFNSGVNLSSTGPISVSAGALTLNSGEAIAVSALNVSGGTLGGADVVTLGDGTWSGGIVSGSLVVPGGATFAITGAPDKTLAGGVITNNGLVNLTGGKLVLGVGATFQNSGTIELTSGTTFSTSGAVFTNAGTIGGSGTFDLGGATLTNNGTLRPGTASGSVGALTITGNLTQAGTGTVNVDLAGTGPGSFDVIAVSGAAALGGTLNVAHLDGFFPPSDSSYNVMTFASSSGDFASKNFPTPYINFYSAAPAPAGASTTYRLSLGAVVNQWTAADSGLWQNFTNWSLGHVPTAGEDALIPNIGGPGATHTVTVSEGFQNARRVTSSENLSVTGGLLTLGAQSSAVLGNATFSVSGGTVMLGGQFAANSIALSGGGFLDVKSGSLPRLTMSGGVLTRSDGDLTISGPFTASGGVIAPPSLGTARLITTGVSSISNVTTSRNWSNEGVLDLGGALILSGANLFTNAAGGRLNVNTGGTMDLANARLDNFGRLDLNTSDATPFGVLPGTGPGIFNAGVLNKNAAAPDFVNLVRPFTNLATGVVNVNAGTLSAAFSGTQSGRMEIAAGAQLNTDGSLTNAPGGVIGGSGTLELFGGTLTNAAATPGLAAAVVRPGDVNGAGGALRITGNFTNNGALDIRLGGQANNQFGQLHASGTANLGGTLALSTSPGYTAPEGDTFRIVNAASFTGDFATTTKTFTTGVNARTSPSFYVIGLGGPDVNSWISDTSGNWNDAAPSPWSLGHVPIASERVFINRPTNPQITIPAGDFAAASLQSSETLFLNGTLTLANTSAVTSVLQVNSGGVLQGAGPVTLANLSLNGTIASTGGVTVTGTLGPIGSSTVSGRLTSTGDFLMVSGGSLAVASGGTLTLTGPGEKRLAGNAGVSNSGTLSLGGTRDLVIEGGSTLTNNAVLALSPVATNVGITGAGSLQNNATLNSGSGATTVIGAPFNNTGTVNVDAGTLRLTGNGTDTGTYAIDGGTTLDIAGGTRNFEGAATATGAGALRLSGGVLDAKAGSLPKLDLAGGTLAGTGPGALTIAGAFNISGGFIAPAAGAGGPLVTAGTTTVTGTIGLSRDWTNRGVLNLDAGQISASSGGGVDFANEGTLNINTANPNPFTAATTTIANRGIINKNLAGLSDLGNPFTNEANGALNVLNGTLRLPASITQSGRIAIAEGASLNTAGQNLANLAGATLGGAGTFDLGAGTLVNTGTLQPGQAGVVPGTLAILGNLSLNGSTLSGPGALTVSGSTGVTTGASILNSALTTNGFALSSGSLTVGATGVLNLTGTGARTIAVGTLGNSGTVNIGGSADVTLSDGALWDNFGTVSLGGVSRIVLGGAGAATLINRGTGVIMDASTNAAPITLAGAAPGGKAFANAGTFTKAVGSADAQTLDVPMTNTGAINVLTGTLVATSFSSNTGSIDLAVGTTFSTSGAPLTNNPLSGILKGNGTLNLGGATFTNSGTVAPGASPGTLMISGNYVQTAAGVLAIELGGQVPGADFDVFRVSGSASLGGTLVVTRTPGTTLTQGSAFELMTYGSRTGDFAGFSVPSGFAFQTAPGLTSYTLTNTAAAVVQGSPEQLTALSQKDAVLLQERAFVTTTPENTDADKERQALGECR